MEKTFIQTKEFSKNWERLGLTDDDMRRLELEIQKNQKQDVYSKNEKDNLTKAECNHIRKLICLLEKSL